MERSDRRAKISGFLLLALVLSSCAEVGVDDGASADTALAPGSRLLPLAEFSAAYDPMSGELTFDTQPLDFARLEREIGADGVATVRQAVYCQAAVSAGTAETFQLATVADSVHTGAAACGFGDATPAWVYAAGTFCGTIAVISHFTTDMYNVTAEIYEREPTDFIAYPPPYGTTKDPAELPEGENRPTWEGGGLFEHGSEAPNPADGTYIPAGERRDRVWAFRYPGERGPFDFQGRIWAEFPDGTTPCAAD